MPRLRAMAYVLFPTAFGTCGLAWNERGLTRFQLPEHTEGLTGSHLAARAGPRVTEEESPAWVREAIGRVRRHFEGVMQEFSDLKLDWSLVSDFQRAVYLQTQLIRPGSKNSYGEIARALALGPEAARAVGAALAANPWPIVVPCHRVVSASGKMTGFSAPGGVLTKTRLLALEGAELLSE
jgi:methylated-DNA-[protein]-cysteine S-methyltransferase